MPDVSPMRIGASMGDLRRKPPDARADGPSPTRDAMVRRIIEHGRVRVASRGQRLLVEGERSGRVIAIVTGAARVFTTDRDGRSIVLAIRGPGDLVGDLSAFTGTRASASVEAMVEMEYVQLAMADFLELVESDQALMRGQVDALIGAWRAADERFVEVVSHDVVQRMARRLVELARRFGRRAGDDEVIIDLPVTQEDLAGLCGASLAGAGRALSSLRAAELIRTSRRHVDILDLAGLTRIG